MPVTFTQAGSATSITSSTSFTITGVTASIGDWLVVVIAADNSATNGGNPISSVTDSAGNTYVQRSKVTGGGSLNTRAALSIFTAQITSGLSSGTVTVNLDTSTVAKAAVIWEVTPSSGKQITYIAGGDPGVAGSGGSGGPITTASLATGQTVIAGIAVERETVPTTGDSDTLNGSWSTQYGAAQANGGSATSMAVGSQWKTVTATGTQTYNPNVGGAAGDNIVSFIVIDEIDLPFAFGQNLAMIGM